MSTGAATGWDKHGRWAHVVAALPCFAGGVACFVLGLTATGVCACTLGAILLVVGALPGSAQRFIDVTFLLPGALGIVGLLVFLGIYEWPRSPQVNLAFQAGRVAVRCRGHVGLTTLCPRFHSMHLVGSQLELRLPEAHVTEFKDNLGRNVPVPEQDKITKQWGEIVVRPSSKNAGKTPVAIELTLRDVESVTIDQQGNLAGSSRPVSLAWQAAGDNPKARHALDWADDTAAQFDRNTVKMTRLVEAVPFFDLLLQNCEVTLPGATSPTYVGDSGILIVGQTEATKLFTFTWGAPSTDPNAMPSLMRVYFPPQGEVAKDRSPTAEAKLALLALQHEPAAEVILKALTRGKLAIIKDKRVDLGDEYQAEPTVAITAPPSTDPPQGLSLDNCRLTDTGLRGQVFGTAQHVKVNEEEQISDQLVLFSKSAALIAFLGFFVWSLDKALALWAK